MIWKTEDHLFKVELSPDIFLKMVEMTQENCTIETGGILVGKYIDNNNTAIIIDALPPPKDSLRSRSTFTRGIEGLITLLKNLWGHSKTKRQYYIGEWHYHPTTVVIPSQTDLDQMEKISRDPNYNCKEPIMIILGNGNSTDRQIKCFLFNQCASVDMEML